METYIEEWKKQAAKHKTRFEQMLNQSTTSLSIDTLQDLTHTCYDAVFDEIDCRQCANCCKTVNVALHSSDIRRITAFLGVPSIDDVLGDNLIEISKDNYLMYKTPCPFLTKDDQCSIYEARPDGCRSYPHIRYANITKNTSMHADNAVVCPAVYHILKRLEAALPF